MSKGALPKKSFAKIQYMRDIMNEIEKHIKHYAGQAGRFSIEQLGGYLDSINDDVPTKS